MPRFLALVALVALAAGSAAAASPHSLRLGALADPCIAKTTKADCTADTKDDCAWTPSKDGKTGGTCAKATHAPTRAPTLPPTEKPEASPSKGHPVFSPTDGQFQVVYDSLSFTFAFMIASTIFFWLRLPSINEKYKAALVITGLVTFIASYHYLRIFNSWVDAYKYGKPTLIDGDLYIEDPKPTGKPFNDAYRYMDWLLTVPLLLIEIVLVMDLSPAETVSKSWQLGFSAAIMIIIGYPGEMVLEKSDLSKRWIFWVLAMIPFLFIVYTLIVGLAKATASEQDRSIRSKIKMAQYWTVISWLTYPIVYIIPMLGASGINAVVGIQIGYCISDIISKCGVGFIIYQVTLAKSKAISAGRLIQDGNYQSA